MRILNLYAGIGGNRALWGDDHDIVAVELEPKVASAYSQLWPRDEVVVGDAHAYLLEHHADFDFIWSSPPCQTHTRMQTLRVRGYGDRPKYPSGMLFEEVVFLANWSPTPYVVENVIPYYPQRLAGAQQVGRHLYWASFPIPPLDEPDEALRRVQIPELEALHGISLQGMSLPNKRQALRNAVSPRVGLHILEAFLEPDRARRLTGGLLDLIEYTEP